ncbi:MAG: flagellar basal body rod protein FlgC [Rickettsiales bacterium]
MDLVDTMHISAAGMRAQSDRLRVVSQNIANADSVGTRAGDLPYRRQTISFKDSVDRETGLKLVGVNRISGDNSEFPRKYEPTNPNADPQGYVFYPNVNPIIETIDMREARRGYEANLDVIQASKSMLSQTINLLR